MSILIIVPCDEALAGTEADGNELLQLLLHQPTRSLVFFDEHITGYVIAEANEVVQLERRVIHLDISIIPDELTSSVDNGQSLSGDRRNSDDANDVKHHNHNVNYNIGEIVLNDDNIVFDDGSNYIIWRFDIDIVYPRKKFKNPKLSIIASLGDNSDETVDVFTDELPHLVKSLKLPNYEAEITNNLFSELKTEINHTNEENHELNTSSIDVSSKSIDKFTGDKPMAYRRSSIYTTSISIPVAISLVLRMKTTKPAGRNNILLATLNLEGSEELNNNFDFDIIDENYCFKIIDLSVEFTFGLVIKFSADTYSFPYIFKSIDMVSFTYKLTNTERVDKDKSIDNSKHVNIKLILQVLKYNPENNSYSNVSNVITTKWAPYVDFYTIAPPINNSLKTSTNYSKMQSQPILPSQGNHNPRKTAMLNSIYNAKSPTNLHNPNLAPQFTISPSSPLLQQPKKMSNRLASSASSVTVNLTTNNNSALSGLKLTFKGKLSIALGEVVIWELQAINKSNNRLNLSLIVQNTINFTPIFTSNNLAVSSSNLLPPEIDVNNMYSEGVKSNNKAGDNKSKILIQNPLHLYSEYFSQKLNTNGVIILDNDIRMGPIEPNGVFETEIKLIGTSCGIFNLDGIKIFDISSGDGLDFGKLVEVFVI